MWYNLVSGAVVDQPQNPALLLLHFLVQVDKPLSEELIRYLCSRVGSVAAGDVFDALKQCGLADFQMMSDKEVWCQLP
jgi:hypothetical protein